MFEDDEATLQMQAASFDGCSLSAFFSLNSHCDIKKPTAGAHQHQLLMWQKAHKFGLSLPLTLGLDSLDLTKSLIISYSNQT